MTALEYFNVGDILLQRFTLISAFTQDVWLASDNNNNNKVVIKHAEEQQLQREWACMQCCNSPYILRSIEYSSKSSLLISPYIKGQNLLSFSPDKCDLFICLLPKITRAINYLHQQGWVHGDIKPSNIIYQPQFDSIQLIDFGSAHPSGKALSELPQWQLTVGFSRNSRRLGVGNIEEADDWFALQQWLTQIDSQLLTPRNQSKLKHWNNWLKKQLN